MKERFCKKNILSALGISAALALTVFLFSPADIYLSSQRDFQVGFFTMLLPMMGISLAAFAVFMLIFMLGLIINKKLFNTMVCLAAGLELAFYVQMFFMNGRVEQLMGSASGFKRDDVLDTLNFVIFYIIMFIPLIVYFFVDQKKKDLKRFFNIRLAGIASCVVIAMQIAGNVSLAVKNGVKSVDDNQYTSYFSYENALSLSKEKNVIVFLTDALDGVYMDEAIERYPDLETELEGFTYYRNNISCYPGTFPMVIQMLTGLEYDGEPALEYADKAWEGESVPQILKRNGFNVNLYLDNAATFETFEQVEGLCDNICIDADCSFDVNYYRHNENGEFDGVMPSMTILSAVKLSPYMMKSFFFEKLSSDFQGNMVLLNADKIPERMDPYVNPASDVKFNKYLMDNELDSDNPSPVFSFIHFSGTHNASPEISRIYSQSKGEDIIDTARGDFQIIFNYIEKMKAAGVYDDSTILILGDHGAGRWMKKEGKIDEPYMTALLVKKAGSRGPLEYDDKSELSNYYFTASILEYAGLDHAKFGESYNDIIENDMHKPRYIHLYMRTNSYLFEVTDNARDIKNWKLLN